MKIRSPDYYNLQALNIISSCHYLADLIAVLGSADFVLGSVDRKMKFSVKNKYYHFQLSIPRGSLRDLADGHSNLPVLIVVPYSSH